MSPELEERLFNKWPRIFRKEANEDYSSFGYLEVSDGWYDLIDSLCETIQCHADNARYRHEKSGETWFEPHATQVKEKWGGLRFYVGGSDDFIMGAITQAEAMSFKICEVCGKPGVKRHSAWVRTLCTDHVGKKISEK
jgi:hypothetical protein